ncbi:MAG: hypothetical protein GX818_03210 [Tissierellia bacterium]|nr:hypothetical protein [Tissierellia bacterium]
MIKVLFICHGNICRSPMAEYWMKDMLKKAGRQDEFEISSFGYGKFTYTKQEIAQIKFN